VVIRNLFAASAMALAIALAGCGGSSAPVRKPKIAFLSPVLNAKGEIPASYRCSGSKVWLPLEWGALPANTKELVIYIARFGRPEASPGNLAQAKLLAQQLIVGLHPTLHKLPVGDLPHGALIGSFEIGNKRTAICPKRGSAQGVLFGIYALPRTQGIQKGTQGGSLLNKLRSEAVALGTFTASYS
jgi:phosphatidylethanolamine-binding protein (PEBP) family uncharacterized protein